VGHGQKESGSLDEAKISMLAKAKIAAALERSWG
jgi:hypothetical protein